MYLSFILAITPVAMVMDISSMILALIASPAIHFHHGQSSLSHDLYATCGICVLDLQHLAVIYNNVQYIFMPLIYITATAATYM